MQGKSRQSMISSNYSSRKSFEIFARDTLTICIPTVPATIARIPIALRPNSQPFRSIRYANSFSHFSATHQLTGTAMTTARIINRI